MADRLSIQAIQERYPWLMAPFEWLDIATTPRRLGRLLGGRVADIADKAVVDTTSAAKRVKLALDPLRTARDAALLERPLLQRVAWWWRRTVWAGIFSSAVFYGLRPKAAPIPKAEKPIRLVTAPETYPDFQARELMVPDSLPEAEMSLSGAMMVQVLHFLQDVYPINAPHQPQASWDPRERLRQVYPLLYRIIRTPPEWHDDLVEAAARGNLLGALAVGGPFAKFLVRRPGTDEYFMDLQFMAAYPVRDGLARLGCTIDFRSDDGVIRVVAITRDDETTRPGDDGWVFAERVALCSLVTHCTVWRHGMQYHVAGLAPVCVETHNLPPDHPIRRLMAAHTAETISTNYHTHLTLRRSGFDVTGLSFSYETILRYYDDGARFFDLRRLDVPADLAERGIPDDLHYPYGTQATRYWEIVGRYVGEYIDHHYPTDEALDGDAAAHRWFDALDAGFTNGIKSYVPSLTREHLARFCSLFIYAVTLEHEENTLWDYAVSLPTMVPADGGPQSVGDVQLAMNFQFLISSATNRLVNDISHLALDDEAAAIMGRFRRSLLDLQAEMEAHPDRYWMVYPKSLEAGVSA